MKIFTPFIWLCTAILTATIALAASETAVLGPASISLDLGDLGSYDVEDGYSSSLDHSYDRNNPDFEYNIYPAVISFDDSSAQVMLEAHQMSTPMPLDTPISDRDGSTGLEHCILQADMMPRMPKGAELQSEPYTIDGQDGILVTVDQGDDNPLYVVAYSPNKSNGEGDIVCIIGSNFPWATTQSIFQSVNVQLA